MATNCPRSGHWPRTEIALEFDKRLKFQGFLVVWPGIGIGWWGRALAYCRLVNDRGAQHQIIQPLTLARCQDQNDRNQLWENH